MVSDSMDKSLEAFWKLLVLCGAALGRRRPGLGARRHFRVGLRWYLRKNPTELKGEAGLGSTDLINLHWCAYASTVECGVWFSARYRALLLF
jgi:hypothetical protein